MRAYISTLKILLTTSCENDRFIQEMNKEFVMSKTRFDPDCPEM